MKPSAFHSNRKWHNWLVYRLRDKFLQKNAHLFKGHLYDLGCGEAPFKAFFLQHVNQYTGVDWAGSPHVVKADIGADLNQPLPIPDQVADSVVAISVLEHLHEPAMMLSEAFRILKSGGTILTQTPWQWMVHEAPYDFYRYSPYGLEYLFKKAGFINIEIEAEAGFFTTWFLKFNYFTSRLIRGPKVLQMILLILLIPIWALTQFLAPLLDRFDNNPALEAGGYIVTAQKP